MQGKERRVDIRIHRWPVRDITRDEDLVIISQKCVDADIGLHDVLDVVNFGGCSVWIAPLLDRAGLTTGANRLTGRILDID